MDEVEPSNEDILASLEEKQEPQVNGDVGDSAPVSSGYQFKSQDELMAHRLKYNADSKEIEEPLSDILKRASQGYHYAQRMNELKNQEKSWQQQIAEANGLAEKYREIDEYARQNPDWFDHWNNAYQNRSIQIGGSPENQGFDPDQITSLIDQKLAPFQETLQQQKLRMEQERVSQEDAALDSQVDSTIKEFQDVDFTATDPNTGKSLEYQIYEFMAQNNIGDFNKAYKIMHYDQIMARNIERAKSDLVKQEQAKKKQGIVSESSGAKRQGIPQDINKLTPDQFEQLQMEELKLLRSQGG